MPTQTVSFDPEQYAEIVKLAEEENISFSKATRKILDEGLNDE